MTIVFLTPEYPVENPRGTGLGSYVKRMAGLLCALGHDIIVVSLTQADSKRLVEDGMEVRLIRREWPLWLRALRRLSNHMGAYALPHTVHYLSGAVALAAAVSEIEREKEIDVLQSSSYGMSGLFIRRAERMVHLQRLSSNQMLWRRTDGLACSWDLKVMNRLEIFAMRRADEVYAPSEWLAEYTSRTSGRKVHVLRPPIVSDDEPSVPFAISGSLPKKYLVHFGSIGPRKGSDFVAKALPLVWEQQPDFTMVWAGRECSPGDYSRCKAYWAPDEGRVKHLGPLERSEMLGVVKGAIASVLPSRVDNLPNTVLESVAMATPVIGTRGSSIDEVIEPGMNGDLVEFGDVDALVRLLLNVWRRGVSWLNGGKIKLPPVFDEMVAESAAHNFIRLAGRTSQSEVSPLSAAQTVLLPSRRRSVTTGQPGT